MEKKFAIVIKVTDQCNLWCPYCYYYAGGAASLRARKHKDTKQKLDALCDAFIGSHRLNTEAKNIQFVLHGGEPLMVPPDIIDHFAKRLREAFPDKAFIGLQTNGVFLSEEWLDVFERNKIYVGVSIDGPKAFHDRNRVHANGAGSYDQAVAGLRLLQNAAAEGRIPSPGILCVYDPELPAKSYFEHFAVELGVNNYDILFPDDLERFPDTSELVRKYQDMISHTWHQWLERDDPKMAVRFIHHALSGLVKGQAQQFDPDHISLCVVDLAGDVYFDDAVRTKMSLEEIRIGSWLDGGFDAALAKSDETILRIKEYPAECLECSYFNACKGGEYLTRLDPVTGNYGLSYLCEVYKTSFRFGEAVLKKLKPRGEIQKELA